MATVFNTEFSSYIAAADLTGKQYYFVKLDSNDKLVLTDAITDEAFGVLQNEPKLGQEGLVKTYGNTKVVAGAAIVAGANVATTATGKAQTAVSTQFSRGKVITAAAADEDIATINLFHDAIALA